MSEMQGKQRSAVVFGARNLGRAVIELLVSDGWAVAGAARSQSTLDGVSAAGALALKADVTDPASVYGVLEQAVAAHGGVELVVNAAAAYGGERTGPFGGGPIAEADLDGFDSWAAAPARAAFSFLSASGTIRDRAGPGSDSGAGHRRLGTARDAGPRSMGGRIVRRASDHQRGRARAAPPGHPGRAAHRRRRHPAARRVHPPRCARPKRSPTRAGSPMPSCSSPTRTRAQRHTSSSSPRSPRTGRPEPSSGSRWASEPAAPPNQPNRTESLREHRAETDP